MAEIGMHTELSKYEITDVEGLEDAAERGRGSFGAVYEVEAYGVPCIAKCLHSILVSYQAQHQGSMKLDEKGVDVIRSKFYDECILHGQLRHPNVVQFLGVHYGMYSGELALIVEKLEWDLGKFVETYKQIPDAIKISLLLDVVYGLQYLHSRKPCIIHRDLSAGNVLVSQEGRAKIADLGASKILTLNTFQMHTAGQPGAFAYMPPEALQANPVYDQSLDVFSFGAVALYTATHKFPYVHEIETLAGVQDGQIQIAKRRVAMKIVENSFLLPLIKHCLFDKPADRPTTTQLCRDLKHLASQKPRQTGDFSRVISKEGEEIEKEVASLKNEVEGLTTHCEYQAEYIQKIKAKNQELDNDYKQLMQRFNSLQANSEKKERNFLDHKKNLLTNISELEKQLEMIKKDLVQNQQRVNARWSIRVKCLETELETLRAEGAPSSQSSGAHGKQQSAETLVSEQEFIHISAFAKKQQLEHAEALAGLEKKISATSDSLDDTRGLHQLNVRLAAEIEDYREQTKRLLQDIAHKDVEIGRLRESLHSGGSQGSDPSNITAAPTTTGTARVGMVPQRSESSTGFNVGALQQTGAELATDVLDLQQQLEAVKKERDSLVQNQQRVNARWDGRVKRLETELETLRAGGAPSSQDNSRLARALFEAQTQITHLEGTLRRERKEIATNTQSSTELQRELREMKDRNTALEHQMVEYAETVKDQSKYIQSSVARGKQQSAETLVSEQEFIHITDFAKKQQLEHAEALAGLEKKISATSDSLDDTRGLHQLNVRLAAEIEDYREQTKRLLQDITHKDVEIGRLRESLHSGGSQGSDVRTGFSA